MKAEQIEDRTTKTTMKTPAPIWIKVVRRAAAAHRTTTKLDYIGKERFG
ncbi:hypothetical protein A2U01_0077005 [Trifolium medium]|uniref:Uncharacterized protein n=1 Tax=Trifolium medium TaxID=97028 RepID=A0A392T5F8_9FABA|nr:hypothetical protein [Trifolium medium]